MKKLLLLILPCVAMLSCKSDDLTCPDIAHGRYTGTIYLYETGKTVNCWLWLEDDNTTSIGYYSISSTTDGVSYYTTYSCKNSQIIFNSKGTSNGTSINLKGLIPLKFEYDAKRKKITSVDDGDNTFGDVEVTYKP